MQLLQLERYQVMLLAYGGLVLFAGCLFYICSSFLGSRAAHFRFGRRESVLLGVVLLCAFCLCYRSPYSASDFGIVPDSVEYGVGALRLLNDGSYSIEVDGSARPPRYAPFFPLFSLVPAYILAGDEPGAAIYAISAYAMLAVAAAWLIGFLAGGRMAAVLSGLAVLMVPGFVASAQEVLTFVPSAALTLLLALLFLLGSGKESLSVLFFGVAGFLVAWAAAIRPLAVLMLLPFFTLIREGLPFRRLLGDVLALCTPVFLLVAFWACYNEAVFGSSARSGYNYWCAVPYDFFWLTFSPSYIWSNALIIFDKGGLLFFLIVGCGILFQRKRLDFTSAVTPQDLKALCTFLMLGCAPLVLVHLLYFFPSPLFTLPFVVLLAVICAAALPAMLQLDNYSPALGYSLLACAVVPALLQVTLRSNPLPERRIAAERVARDLPRAAAVISAIDPVYLGYFMHGSSNREIIPISRRVEYASKLIMPEALHETAERPLSWNDHRWAALKQGGAIEAVRHVALADREYIKAQLLSGRKIYLEPGFVRPDELEALKRDFTLTGSGNLLTVELPPQPPG